MNKKTIIANFKMNKTDKQVSQYFNELIPQVKDIDAIIGVAPSFVSIKTAVKKVKDTNILVGAQNMNENDSGAYTGEVSPQMLNEIGVKIVLLGHSERRNIFRETDEIVNKKLLKALKVNLISVLCIGETLTERNNNKTEQVLNKQLSVALNGVYQNEFKNIIIAYEPVWAIGTGKVPTKEQICDAMKSIRKTLADLYSKDLAEKVTILYGGSVNENNAKEIANIKGVDGTLVGGASLDANKFASIINAFIKKS